MIHYLKISNFGPVNEMVELNFETVAETESADDLYSVQMTDGVQLLKLAYIYGANASGKTTILKAFEFLRELLLKPLPDKSAQLDYQPFLFRSEPLIKPSAIELAFYSSETRYVYYVEFNTEAIISEKLHFFHSAKPTEVFNRETDLESRVVQIKFGNRIKVPAKERDRLESNTLHNNTVLGAFTKTNADIPELNALNLWLNSFLLGIVTIDSPLIETTAEMIAADRSANAWLDAFMNKADRQIGHVQADQEKSLSPRSRNSKGSSLKDLLPQGSFQMEAGIRVNGMLLSTPKYFGGGDIFNFERKVNITHRTAQGAFELPIEAESKGTQRYFALGGPLYTLVHRPSILLIDELEASLHPDLMKHFLQTFLANAGASQMLITTHNIALMEETDFIRRDALWFSEKRDDGSVDLYSAADFDTSKLRKASSLINAYRSGKLGAKPNLGSPYISEQNEK